MEQSEIRDYVNRRAPRSDRRSRVWPDSAEPATSDEYRSSVGPFFGRLAVALLHGHLRVGLAAGRTQTRSLRAFVRGRPPERETGPQLDNFYGHTMWCVGTDLTRWPTTTPPGAMA
jgi:hypothetical protein